MVENNESIPGPEKFDNIELPSRYKHLSYDDEVKIVYHTDNEFILGFWVSRGLYLGPCQMMYYSFCGVDEFLNKLDGTILHYKKMDNFWYYAKIY